MKIVLQDIIANDTSYNKSATRYLFKTHPELWQQILEKTSFLPETAKPKQRIWHILNDVYEIPLCPIENTPVKWHDNRYLITSSRTAKQKYKWNNGDYANAHTEESNKLRSINNVGKTVASGKRKPQIITEETIKQRVVKAKETCLERYGVENGSQAKVFRDKISDARIQNGATPKHLRSARRLYYDAVWKITEENWKNHFDKINPKRLNRTYNALDHIYSIQQGFRESIPPYIIGHYTNLRIISLSENSIKGMRCDKSKEELFADFDDKY